MLRILTHGGIAVPTTSRRRNFASLGWAFYLLIGEMVVLSWGVDWDTAIAYAGLTIAGTLIIGHGQYERGRNDALSARNRSTRTVMPNTLPYRPEHRLRKESAYDVTWPPVGGPAIGIHPAPAGRVYRSKASGPDTDKEEATTK
jgi:hypothetical protein